MKKKLFYSLMLVLSLAVVGCNNNEPTNEKITMVQKLKNQEVQTLIL